MHRDLVRGLRRPRAFVLLCILIAAEIYFAGYCYPETVYVLSRVRGAADAIYLCFVVGSLVGAAVIIPGAAALSVVLEREQETYDLVRMTAIRRGTFFLAKVCNVWGYYLILIIATMPIAAVLFFLVGIEVRQATMSTGIVLAASSALTCIGVAVSCRVRHSARALVWTFLFGFVFMGGHVLILAMLDANRVYQLPAQSRGAWEPWLMAMAPPMGIPRIHYGQFGFDVFWRAIVYFAAVAVLFGVWGWRALHRADTGVEHVRFGRRAGRFRPIPDWANPVAAKERMWSSGMQRGGLWILTVTVWVFLAVIALWAGRVLRDPTAAGLFTCVLVHALVALITPLAITHPLAREKDTHSLDMLRMTMLSSREVVLGKVWASGRYLVYMLLGIPIVYTLSGVVLQSGMKIGWLIGGMLSGGVSVFFFAGLCAWIGAYSRRSSTAMTASWASGFGVGIGLPLVLGFLGMTDGGTTYIVSMISPFLGWAFSMNGGDHLPCWLFSIALFTGLGVVLFHAAIARYLIDVEAQGGDAPVVEAFQ